MREERLDGNRVDESIVRVDVDSHLIHILWPTVDGDGGEGGEVCVGGEGGVGEGRPRAACAYAADLIHGTLQRVPGTWGVRGEGGG